jgi:hypothetical protein
VRRRWRRQSDASDQSATAAGDRFDADAFTDGNAGAHAYAYGHADFELVRNGGHIANAECD